MKRLLALCFFYLTVLFGYSQCISQNGDCPPDDGGDPVIPIGGGGGPGGGGPGGGSGTFSAPVATQETNRGTSQFMANWNAVSGATAYLIDVSPVSSFSSYVSGYQGRVIGGTLIGGDPFLEGPDGGVATLAMVGGLSPGRKYYYRVRAVNATQTSGNSNTVTANTTIDKPTAQQESSRTTTSFTARWGSVSGALSYKLDVSTSSSFSSMLSGYNSKSVNGTSSPISGLAPGKNYFYRVRAVGQDITSASSSTITANTSISTPTKIEESNRTTTSFIANWGSVSGAQSYRLDVSTIADFSTKLAGYNDLNVGSGTSKSITSLTPGKDYYYRVRAVGPNYSSNNSARVTANTIIAIPSQVQEINNTSTSFTARWGTVTGAQSYRLDVATANNFSSSTMVSGYSNLNVASASSRSVTGLIPGRNYYYRVRAVGQDISSSNSSYVTANTTMPAPVQVQETGNATTSFTARWGSVSGTQTYRLDVSTSSNFSSKISGYDNLNVGNVTNRAITGLIPGKNYYYRIRAVGQHYTSGNSLTVTANTSIFSPSKLQESNNSTTSFTARWGSVSGAQSYRLDVSETSSFSSKLSGYQNLDVGNTTNRTVSGLTPGKNYYYRVRAVGVHYTSGNSTYVTANTTIPAPSQVQEVGNTATSFTAKWGSVSGATSYQLDVSTTSNFSSKLSGYDNLNVGVVTNRAITGLISGKNYYYRVRAVGSSITSPSSSSVTANTTMPAPGLVQEADNTGTSFTARWGSVSGAQSYRLDVSTTSNFISKLSGYDNLNVGTTTNRTITGLISGKNYYYRVRAAGQHYTSDNSSTVTANTRIFSPSKRQESNNTTTSFKARWGAVSGAQSYRLDVATASDFSNKLSGYQNLNVGNVTSRIVSGLTPGKNYYYRVRAVGMDHTSGNSNYVVANSTIDTPVVLEETNKQPSSFVANWNAVPSAESYTVQVSTASNFSSILQEVSPNFTSITINGLNLNSTHYYRVRANGEGSGIVEVGGQSLDVISSSYSPSITVHVFLNPGTISYTNTVCSGSSPSLISGSGATGGNGSYEYQWQYYNGSTWQTLSSSDQEDFDPSNTITVDTKYRRRVRSDADWIPSNELIIQVLNPIINIGTLSITAGQYCPGDDVDFSFTKASSNVSLLNTTLEVLRKGAWVNLGIISETKSARVTTEDAFRVRYEQPCSSSTYSNTINLTLRTDCVEPPSLDQNFVRVETPRVEIASSTELSLLSAHEKSTAFSYSDGVGRGIQSTAVQSGPNFEDVISFSKFNPENGMQDTRYLPFARVTDVPGQFSANPLQEQATFYSSSATKKIDHDSKPYGYSTYDDRYRVKSVMAPGEDWHEADKKITTDYRLYDESVDGFIPRWWASGDDIGFSTYENNSLSILISVDEQGRKVRQLTEARGLTISSQLLVDEVNNKWTGSYRVFDDLGRLRYTIPPIVADGVNSTDIKVSDLIPKIEKLAFQYQYGNRGRLIRKKAPSSGWTEYVYDGRDRLVLSRHQEQFLDGDASWSFVKYDGLNRPIASGQIATNQDREMLQEEVNSFGAFVEKREAPGYENSGYTMDRSFPRLSDFSNHELLSISYFDNYSFLDIAQWDEEGNDFSLSTPAGFNQQRVAAPDGYTLLTTDYTMQQVEATSKFAYVPGVKVTIPAGVRLGDGFKLIEAKSTYSTNTIDLPTGNQTKILGQDKWLNSVIYYDERHRIIQAIGENHLGGLDRETDELDWKGELQKVYSQHSGNETLNVLYEYEYDHRSRPLKTYQTINDQNRVVIADYHYNVLGELVEKNLHSEDDGVSYLQSVDYRYNIRGWLSSINDPQLKSTNTLLNDDDNDIFGMGFNYQTSQTINGLTSEARYDGSMSSIEWTADNKIDDRFKPSITAYNYDERNQLTNTNYATHNGQSWINNAHDYDFNSQYDANGNIQTLTRNSSNGEIDNLDYTYGSGDPNQLREITDNSDESEGMNDYFSGTDYAYDNMGNMTSDLNKKITAIEYNHLQLVSRIEFDEGQTEILYSYDAARNKLAKRVLDRQGNEISRIDYLGGIEYLDGEINQLFTGEGRAYKQAGSFHYEYFITDHQENTRAAFGNLPDRNIYTVTAESENHAYEESHFAFDASQRILSNNHTPLGKESIHLNGTVLNRQVGPSKVLSIAANDEVSLEVWAKYNFSNWDNSAVTGFLSTFLSTLGSGGSQLTSEQANATLSSTFGDPSAAGLFGNAASDQPRAYLQYIFFDDQYEFVSELSGYQEVGEVSSGKYAKLSSGDLTFDRPGYLLVYIANESNQDQEVYFDDLKITHETSTSNFKVTQVNEYYPFGLPTSNSWRAEGYMDPGLLYQSSYASYDSLTGYYDFLSRSYDPATGRFFAVDPAGQFASPYVGMGNMPHAGVDPTGEIFSLAPLAIGAIQSLFKSGVESAGYAAADALNGGNFGESFIGRGFSTDLNFGGPLTGPISPWVGLRYEAPNARPWNDYPKTLIGALSGPLMTKAWYDHEIELKWKLWGSKVKWRRFIKGKTWKPRKAKQKLRYDDSYKGTWDVGAEGRIYSGDGIAAEIHNGIGVTFVPNADILEEYSIDREGVKTNILTNDKIRIFGVSSNLIGVEYKNIWSYAPPGNGIRYTNDNHEVTIGIGPATVKTNWGTDGLSFFGGLSGGATFGFMDGFDVETWAGWRSQTFK